MDKLITKIYQQDLTGQDVDYLTKNKAVLLLYKDLLNYNSIFDAFSEHNVNNIILLFPVQSDTEGHYICVQKNDKTKTVSHFDSYGISPDQELGYTNIQYVKKNILGMLYNKAQQQGWKFTYNKYQLQSWGKGVGESINTCGRWSCMKARMDYLNNDEFASLFLKQRFPPDWYVTILTFVALSEDEQDEETIIRSLGLKK